MKTVRVIILVLLLLVPTINAKAYELKPNNKIQVLYKNENYSIPENNAIITNPILEIDNNGNLILKKRGYSYIITDKNTYKLFITPKKDKLTSSINDYLYLTISGGISLDEEEQYLLDYTWSHLPSEVKESLISNKIKIQIVKPKHKIFQEYNNKTVGLFTVEDGKVFISLKANRAGCDALSHEIGHYWNYINNNLCKSIENEYNENRLKYGVYASKSLSEYYATKFQREIVLKDYKWYLPEYKDGYS